MPNIAPTATVDSRAELARDVEVGPGCYIGPHVKIGPGSRLMSNVSILGNTEIGAGNLFYPGVTMGAAPQDLKYEGGATRLVIGNENTFRENVTAHTGTELGGGLTKIGDHNQFQVGSHIAHDVMIGSNCILSNLVQIAGHAIIEDCVTISGLTGVQQFVTIGSYSFIAGMARCSADTPPYVIAGVDGSVQGINVKGLGRWGFDDKIVQELRDLCKKLFPRRNPTQSHYGLRNLYNRLRSSDAEKNVAANMARRIKDAESGTLGQHGRVFVDFVKRSIHQGIHGRYLESQRRDSSGMRARFYRQAEQSRTATADPALSAKNLSTKKALAT